MTKQLLVRIDIEHEDALDAIVKYVQRRRRYKVVTRSSVLREMIMEKASSLGEPLSPIRTDDAVNARAEAYIAKQAAMMKDRVPMSEEEAERLWRANQRENGRRGE